MAVPVAMMKATADFATGDLVFVRPHFERRRALDDAILDVGQATISWLREHGVTVSTNETVVHVGLAWRNSSTDGSLSFIEATPPAVRLTPADTFFRLWPDATFFRAVLRDPLAHSRAERAAELALATRGTPYAYDFSAPPAAFYCSSLVRWAYQQALGGRPHVFVDRPFELIFVPHAFWKDYYAQMHQSLPPPNTTGSNPTLLLHSAHVRFEPFPPPPAPPPPAPTHRRPPHHITPPPSPPPPASLLEMIAPGGDLTDLTVRLEGVEVWRTGTLAFLADGRWCGRRDLVPPAED